MARGMFDDVPVDELELPIVVAYSNSNYVLLFLAAGVSPELRILY